MKRIAWSCLLGAFLVACGSENSSGSSDRGSGAGSECSAIYDAAKCSANCKSDGECPTGLHCASGSCDAECGPSAACDGGRVCSSRGRCEVGISIDPGGMGGNGPDCAYADVAFEKEHPNVLLLIDQSGSMEEALGDSDRWNVVRDILVGPGSGSPDKGIVSDLEADVRFGISLYSAKKAGSDAACPALGSIPLSFGNYTTIESFYRGEVPESGTPTGEAFESVSASLLADTEPGRKVIVLATDGEPDLCSSGSTSDAARERVVTAVEAAHGAGITTYVISVGTEIGTDHLQEVANVGLGLPRDESATPAQYFQSETKDALEKAFRDIIFGVRSCVVKLDGEVALEDAGLGTVELGGEKLVLADEARGFRLKTSTEIELLGTACEDWLETSPPLSIRFPCGVVVR